jgi:hypothetical protein
LRTGRIARDRIDPDLIDGSTEGFGVVREHPITRIRLVKRVTHRFIAFLGLMEFIGLIWFVSFIWFIEFIGLIWFVSFIWFIGLFPHTFFSCRFWF